MNLDYWLSVLLESYCLREFKEIAEGEYEIRDGEVVCFGNEEGLECFEIVLPDPVELILHVIDGGHY